MRKKDSRFILLLLMVIIPGVLFSQAYQIPVNELKNGGATAMNKYKTNTVDLKKNTGIAAGKITFTGLVAGDFENIKVQCHGNKTVIKADSNANDGNAVFKLSDAMSNAVNSFDIFYGDAAKGTIVFTLKQKNGTQANSIGPKDDSSGQATDDTKFQSYVSALASATFVGNNKFLNNLTPVVNLGAIIPLVNKEWFSWKLDADPYIGSTIDSKDSTAFIPALMLYGRGGLILNNYLEADFGKTKLTLMPFGFGLKFIPGVKDSLGSLIQHNLRFGAALMYSNIFMISAQYTHGWHNTTSESQQNFKRIFGNTATDIDYLLISGQFALVGKVSSITNYVFFEWRGLLSKERYAPFTNNTILTLGIRKTLELSGGTAFPAGSDSNSRSRGSKVVHYNF